MEKILKVSLLIAIAGIYLLFLLSALLQPNSYSISDLSGLRPGANIQTSGTLIKIKNSEDMQILFLAEKNSTIQVLAKNIDKSLLNKKLTIFGKLSEYNAEDEIIASKILEE